MALQLYSYSAKMNTDARQNLEKDPWGSKEGINSVNSSPRSKATRVSYAHSEYQIMVSFVKMNMPLFLRLISSDIHNKEVSLSATEFNTLRVLFKVVDANGKCVESNRPKSAQQIKGVGSFYKPLSSYTPFFQQPALSKQTASAKVHMNTLIDWINSLLLTVEPTENQFKLNSLNKCVATKSFMEIYPHYGTNCRMSIVNCEDSNVYIDANVETLLISSCINCTIFVAAVNKVVTMEKCEKTTLCVTAN